MRKVNAARFIILVIVFSILSVSQGFSQLQITPDSIKIAKPISYISIVQEGNKSVYNDSLSLESVNLILSTIGKYSFSLDTLNLLNIGEGLKRANFEKEVEGLFVKAQKSKSKDFSGIELSAAIDSILSNQDKRYVLFTLSSGFTRLKGNYGKQIAKGVGLGILTMGMYYQVPFKGNSMVASIMLDKETKKIVFYKKSYLQDQEPLKPKVLEKQIKHILKDILYKPII